MADLEDRLAAAGEHWRSAHDHVAAPNFAAVTAVAASTVSTDPGPATVTPIAPAAPRRRWRWAGPVLAAAVVAGVVVTAVALRGSHTSGPSTSPTTVAAPSPTSPASTASTAAGSVTDPAKLYGVEWQLIESTYGSKHLTGPEAEAATVRFDGKGGMTAHACNYLDGAATIGTGTMTVQPGMTTDMACATETEAAIQPIFSPADWEITDGDLHIHSGTGDLTFRVRPSIYPSDPLAAGSHVLEEGPHGAGDYRLIYLDGSKNNGDVGLEAEMRGAPGASWGSGGMMLGKDEWPPSTLGCMGMSLGKDRYVFGFTPAGTARVEATTKDGTELGMLKLRHPEWSQDTLAYTGWLAGAPKNVTVTAYDADGKVITPVCDPHF